MTYHRPVLLQAAIEGLNINRDGIYVDVTFGGGGHSKAILNELSAKGRLIGFDQDIDSAANILNDERFQFVRANFRYFQNFMNHLGESQVNGILADLGVSSHQLDTPERGFSFRYEAELDMRMNHANALTASTVLHEYSEDELLRVFSNLGEVRNSKSLSKTIIQIRQKRRIRNTEDLLQILNKIGIGNRQKYIAQVFQALRMEVNDEFYALMDFLKSAGNYLLPRGRLVVISYHSLEDRLVKQLLKNRSGEWSQKDGGKVTGPVKYRMVNKKIIVPDAGEIDNNPRARSAKMRIGERIE